MCTQPTGPVIVTSSCCNGIVLWIRTLLCGSAIIPPCLAAEAISSPSAALSAGLERAQCGFVTERQRLTAEVWHFVMFNWEGRQLHRTCCHFEWQFLNGRVGRLSLAERMGTRVQSAPAAQRQAEAGAAAGRSSTSRESQTGRPSGFMLKSLLRVKMWFCN